MRHKAVMVGLVLFCLVYVGVWVVYIVGSVVDAEQPETLADTIERVRGSVVHIETPGGWQGSGCLISPDGIVFTAKHVTDATPGVYCVTLDGGEVFRVKYAVEDKENDVAFLQLDLAGHEPNLPFAELTPEDSMRVGDSVFLFGSPLGKDNINTVSTGILSALNRNLYDRDDWGSYRRYNWHVMLQTTSPAFPGNSGGPCFNMDGQVIGVLVAGQGETLNFSVPVSRFYAALPTVREWLLLNRFRVVPDPTPVVEFVPSEEYQTSHSSMF